MNSSSPRSTIRASVVLCCFNSESRIGPTLQALAAQEFAGAWEVLVVDNRSTDGTASAAKANWRRADVPLTVLYEARQGLVWARICGLSAACGEWICFVDDDNHLAPRYLAIADEVFSRYPAVGMIGGEGEPQFLGTPPEWLVPEWWTSLALGPQERGEGVLSNKRDYLYGAGLCIRRQVWKDIQKANWRPLMQGRSGKVLLSGEDAEMCLVAFAMGWAGYFCPRMRFRHVIPSSRLTWSYWLRLYEGFGRTAAAYNTLRDALHRRYGLRGLAALFVRACYALAHLPGIPFFLVARKVFPDGSTIAIRSSFRVGYALQGMRGVIGVWRATWWRQMPTPRSARL